MKNMHAFLKTCAWLLGDMHDFWKHMHYFWTNMHDFWKNMHGFWKNMSETQNVNTEQSENAKTTHKI